MNQLLVILAAGLAVPAMAFAEVQPAALSASTATPMSEEALGDQRGGVATPMGVDIGFGASVRTYVDGSLALETRMTLTSEGLDTQRVYESAAAAALTGGSPIEPNSRVIVAPGTTVIHDLSDNRIASVIMNTANDRILRQESDITFYLPQLPELQQQLGTQRLIGALQGLSPEATGLAR